MALHHRDVEATWVVEVGGEKIETTDEHPLYVAGQGWTEAEDLQVGDLLIAEGGDRLTLDKAERVEGAPGFIISRSATSTRTSWVRWG